MASGDAAPIIAAGRADAGGPRIFGGSREAGALPAITDAAFADHAIDWPRADLVPWQAELTGPKHWRLKR
jgi:hypothetical protein